MPLKSLFSQKQGISYHILRHKSSLFFSFFRQISYFTGNICVCRSASPKTMVAETATLIERAASVI